MERQAVNFDTQRFQSHLVKTNVLQSHHAATGQLHSCTAFVLAEVLKCSAVTGQDSESHTNLTGEVSRVR